MQSDEEVGAAQGAADCVLVRQVGDVGVVEVEHLEGRDKAGIKQVLGQAHHVDQARTRRGEVRAGGLGGIVRVPHGAARRADAAARIAPGAGEGGETGDGADGLAAAAATLHPEANAKRRRPGLAKGAGKFSDLGERHVAGTREVVQRKRAQAFDQLVKADGVAVDVVVVDQFFVDNHLHQGQREGGVGGGANKEVLVADARRAGAIGVDGDNLGAAASGLQRPAPDMHTGVEGVVAPK